VIPLSDVGDTLEGLLFMVPFLLIDFPFGSGGGLFLEIVLRVVGGCVGWGFELKVHAYEFSCEKLIE
jgi:hypothetical protein